MHIADVANFVKPGMAVDKEAKFRCTSCYMPTGAPDAHALCNHLCSLQPNEPKCAFSCFFRVKNGGSCSTSQMRRGSRRRPGQRLRGSVRYVSSSTMAGSSGTGCTTRKAQCVKFSS